MITRFVLLAATVRKYVAGSLRRRLPLGAAALLALPVKTLAALNAAGAGPRGHEVLRCPCVARARSRLVEISTRYRAGVVAVIFASVQHVRLDTFGAACGAVSVLLVTMSLRVLGAARETSAQGHRTPRTASLRRRVVAASSPRRRRVAAASSSRLGRVVAASWPCRRSVAAASPLSSPPRRRRVAAASSSRLGRVLAASWPRRGRVAAASPPRRRCRRCRRCRRRRRVAAASPPRRRRDAARRSTRTRRSRRRSRAS